MNFPATGPSLSANGYISDSSGTGLPACQPATAVCGRFGGEPATLLKRCGRSKRGCRTPPSSGVHRNAIVNVNHVRERAKQPALVADAEQPAGDGREQTPSQLHPPDVAMVKRMTGW